MRSRSISVLLYSCFFISGASGLIYEIVWMRKLALVFGSTVEAVSTVVAVFMGGLALGSWLFGRKVDSAGKPLKLYVFLELGIAASGVIILLILLPALDNAYIFLHSLGLKTGTPILLARLLLAVLILLLPTALMGGTLPVMSRFIIRSQSELGSRISTLYGINTLGAVAGSISTGFWFIALFGEPATVWMAVAGNLTAALLALTVSVFSRKVPAVGEVKEKAYRAPNYEEAKLSYVPWLFAVSGFASLALEVLWTRALLYFVGLSVHAFTIILTSFLAGIALGSLIVRSIVDRTKKLFLFFGVLQWIIAASTLASVPLFGKLPIIYQRLNLLLGANTWSQTTLVKFFLCLAVLGLPTLAMGAAFPVVNRLYIHRRASLGRGVGTLYSANTSGTILGSLAAGFLLLPLAGITGSILFVACLNMAVAAACFFFEDHQLKAGKWLPLTSSLSLLAIMALVYFSGSIGPVVRYSLQDPGKDILFCREGTEASIAVLRNSNGYRELNINGESTAYTGFEDIMIHKLLAHLPILFHPGPQNILVVGFGFGSTVYTATTYNLPQVECVELVPDEILTAKYFYPENHGVLDSSGVEIIFEDGRNLILTSTSKYDIISFNAIHPKLSPMLYTLDFYRLCARALAPHGTICAWLPTNGLTLMEFKILLRSFTEVFPHSSLWYCNPANLILLGSSEPLRIDFQAFSKNISRDRIRENLQEVRLDHPLSLLSLFLIGENRLRELLSDVPLNTDSKPIIEFSRTVEPNVPLETYRWIKDNMEPMTDYLVRDKSSSFNKDSLGRLVFQIKSWYEARRVFYEGKFASWGFQEPMVAAGLYRKAAEMNPADSYIRYFLEGPLSDPDSLARAASANPSDFVSRYMLGDYCLNSGDIAKAKHWFSEVVNIRPDHAQAWFNLGLCSAKEGNPVDAERFFLRALSIHPASPESLVNLGLLYYRRKDYSRAEKYYLRAIKTSPGNANALFNLGTLNYRLGRMSEAERFFREAISYNPFKAEAYLNLGALLAKNGARKEAVDNYQQAIELSPGFIPAYMNLALTYQQMGDSLNARKYQLLAERLQSRTGGEKP